MPEKKKNNFWMLMTVIVLCSLAGGVLGEIVTRVYFLKDFSVPYLSSDLNINDLNSNRSNLVIQDAKKVVVNEDVKITETLSSLNPSLIGIFKEVSVSTSTKVVINNKTTASKDATPVNADYYQLDMPYLTGLAITADGWAMLSLPAALKKDFSPKGLVAITSDRHVYKIDQINSIANIPGDIYLVHLSGAQNLAIKKNVVRTNLSLGQSVLVVKNAGSVWPTSLISIDKGQKAISSDSLALNISLAGNLADSQEHSFIFNLNGDLVGVIDEQKNVVPIFAYDYFLQSTLKNNVLSRPYFGVNYLDLSVVKPLNINLEKGAWLSATPDKAAVLKDSPAALAGLQEGDVITWIDNQEINSSNDLADVISAYKAGSSITVTYQRNNQEQETKVTLGALK